jgi:hypothetical protein
LCFNIVRAPALRFALVHSREVTIVKKDVRPSEDEPAKGAGHYVSEAVTPFVHAFWHVERSIDEEDERINMRMSSVEVSIDGQNINLPIMINKRKVDANTLLVCAPPAKKAK